MRFQNQFGPSVTTCVLSIYNLKLDRDCGQHSNSQSTYLCVLLRNQNWLKIGQLTSIARALYFLSPNLETQWSKMFKIFKIPIVLKSFQCLRSLVLGYYRRIDSCNRCFNSVLFYIPEHLFLAKVRGTFVIHIKFKV